MHDARDLPGTTPTPSRRRRKALALERIAASSGSACLAHAGRRGCVVTGIAVALGATSFVVANAADIRIAPTLCSSSTSTIRGTAGNDVLVGTSGNDIIWGGGGDDVISGLQGNDRLCGVDGNDRLYGGSGDDYLDGALGTDILRGDSGRRDTCLNGEQRAGCELVGTTTPTPTTTTPPTTAPPTTAPTTTPRRPRHRRLAASTRCPSERHCRASAVRGGRPPVVREPADQRRRTTRREARGRTPRIRG